MPFADHRGDRVLVVDCPVDVQIERVMARDELTRQQVDAIMQSQATRSERLDMADDIIENSGSLDSLRVQVENLHHKYMEIANRLRR